MLPRKQILALTGSSTIEIGERVQSLWSGYGEIMRVDIDGVPAIVKHVTPPQSGQHPRGWNTNRSHERKLRSYDVELAWYRDWSSACDSGCRVPRTLAVTAPDTGGWLFVLEDLDASGFSQRRGLLDRAGVTLCLEWLAEFHATFLGESPIGLWEIGTYWHLETRPDELAEMADGDLKGAAAAIDAALSGARYRTFVHGDAKVANFCFTPDGRGVAAVDFQYVGGGCGMKDVAYLLGSCLDEQECQKGEAEYLEVYFAALRASLARRRVQVNITDLETEWRTLFPLAWTDFYRFLAGWSPGHPKMNPYSERVARQVLAALGT
jgi:hypothetical protein